MAITFAGSHRLRRRLWRTPKPPPKVTTKGGANSFGAREEVIGCITKQSEGV